MYTKKYLYFVTVVQAGNISRAAKVLNISQPPLSMFIKQLEKDMQISLIIRGSRYIKLTPAGEYFYEQAKKILSYEKQIEDELVHQSYSKKQAIKIGIISSVTDIVMEALANLDDNVNYSIYEANTYELLDKLQQNDLDLAIIRTPYIMNNYDYRNLKKDALCLYGNLTNFKINNINDLDNIPLIIYRRWETVLKDKFQQANIQPNIIMICDDARTCVAAADNDMGITIIPKSIPALKKNKVVIPFSLTESSIHVIKSKKQNNLAALYIYNSLELK